MREGVCSACRVGVCSLVVGAMLVLPACRRQAVPVSEIGREAVPPEVQRALIAAHRSLIEAFEGGDTEGVIRLLDPSPELLIFHPMLRGRFDSIARIKAELPAMFAAFGKATWTEVHPIVVASGDVGWVTSNVLIEAERLDTAFVGRATEIWVHRDGRWRLIHGHWSSLPPDRP